MSIQPSRVSKLAAYGLRSALTLIVGLALLGLLPETAHAADPVDLELGGGGATSWNISNIMPGDSGTEIVTLHNAGYGEGYLAVWIDNIIDSEGDNPESESGDTTEPGELSQYLTLNMSGDNISPHSALPGFTLPAALSEFPHSASQPLHLGYQPLKAGETFQIQWEWSLPPQTTNVVQGDSVSFDIHYILTHNPPPSGGGYWPGEPAKPEDDGVKISETQTPAFSDNNTRIYYSPDRKLIIIVPGDTMVVSAGNEVLSYVYITFHISPPPVPEDAVLLTPIYQVTSFTPQGVYKYPQLNRWVTIVIYFDKDKLPEGFTSVYPAFYDEDLGWVKLTDVLELNYKAGIIKVVTTRLATVALFAEPGTAEDFVEGVPYPGDEGPKPAPPDSKSTTIPKGIPSTKLTRTQEILSQISLFVAVSGALAMIILAYIERRRRERRQAVKS